MCELLYEEVNESIYVLAEGIDEERGSEERRLEGEITTCT
jgi:hypothetical protein